MMLRPDVLDRRALALLALVDGFGRPLRSPVGVVGDGVRSIAKPGGRVVVLEAPGFAAHSAAFDAPPASPAMRSKKIALDLTPYDRAVLPRRFVLRLPRKGDPSRKDDPLSVFQPDTVAFSASPLVRGNGSACILRVAVSRAGDGARVGNALVRAQTSDGAFTASALTDAAGEAALVFPALPIAFAGPSGTTLSGIAARAVVHADPDSATFADPAALAHARSLAAGRTTGHADPDALAAHDPDFASGAAVQLAAGTEPFISLQWTAP